MKWQILSENVDIQWREYWEPVIIFLCKDFNSTQSLFNKMGFGYIV